MHEQPAAAAVGRSAADLSSSRGRHAPACTSMHQLWWRCGTQWPAPCTSFTCSPTQAVLLHRPPFSFNTTPPQYPPPPIRCPSLHMRHNCSITPFLAVADAQHGRLYRRTHPILHCRVAPQAHLHMKHDCSLTPRSTADAEHGGAKPAARLVLHPAGPLARSGCGFSCTARGTMQIHLYGGIADQQQQRHLRVCVLQGGVQKGGGPGTHFEGVGGGLWVSTGATRTSTRAPHNKPILLFPLRTEAAWHPSYAPPPLPFTPAASPLPSSGRHSVVLPWISYGATHRCFRIQALQPCRSCWPGRPRFPGHPHRPLPPPPLPFLPPLLRRSRRWPGSRPRPRPPCSSRVRQCAARTRRAGQR